MMPKTKHAFFHTFSLDTLGAYDIRGVVGKNLFPQDAYFLGLGIHAFLEEIGLEGDIIIGRDSRLSSPKFNANLVSGLLQAGAASIIDLGLAPSSAIYFALHTLDKIALCIVITGSHNPAEHNGFKILAKKRPIGKEDLLQINRIMNRGVAIKNNLKLAKKYVKFDINQLYLDRLLNAIKHDINLKIAWDASSGAACHIIRMLTEAMPGEHIMLNIEPDGSFPGHPPDLSDTRNLEQLRRVVLKNSCDFGFAFDGDGDRLVVITETGQILTGEHLLLLFAKELLKTNPDASIIMDIKMSDLVYKEIKNSGGRPIVWKTGHTLIKQKMLQEGALLAGELSGHFFLANNYYAFDDALMAACVFLEIVSSKNNELKQIIDLFKQRVRTPEIKVKLDINQKFHAMNQLSQLLIDSNIEFCSTDGIRVTVNEGWWLIRASNTEEALIIRAEQADENKLEATIAFINKLLKKACGMQINKESYRLI